MIISEIVTFSVISLTKKNCSHLSDSYKRKGSGNATWFCYLRISDFRVFFMELRV